MKKKNKKIINKQSQKEQIAAYLMILIPVIGFLIFTVAATGYSFFMSFTKYNYLKGTVTYPKNISEFFQNYTKLFKNREFLDACGNTVVLLLSIPIGISIGLLLAVYLKRIAHGSKLLSLLYYLPAITSAVAINIVWKYMFNYEYGLLNKIFGTHINWFDTSDYWMIKIAIMVRGIWGSIGATMVLYLAGLNNIPNDYYESSAVDGASKWNQLIHITIPLLNPTTFYLLVTAIIGGLQSYADAQIFASGNQQARTVVYYIWTYGIGLSNPDYGLASAASILLAAVICTVTIIQFKRTKMMDI